MPIEKIIVLEDDLILRKNLEQQLRQRRYDVAATGTIAGAQEIMAKDTFDLIFLDGPPARWRGNGFIARTSNPP